MAHLKEFYTDNDEHPEDVIYRVKEFVRELSKVQESYIIKTVNRLRLNKDGEELLFDYVFNTELSDYDGFDHYLETLGKNYKNFIK
jgi:hypothetical protein